MASHVILPLGTENAPADAVVPNAGDWPLECVFAHFDGTSAGVAWLPVLQILSSSGATVAEIAMDAPVAAGASVDATWAPFLGKGGGGGGSGGTTVPLLLGAPDAANGYIYLLSTAGVRLLVPAFPAGVNSQWWGVLDVPNNYASGGTIVLWVATSDVLGHVSRWIVATGPSSTGASWDVAPTPETAQNVAMPVTAYEPAAVLFPLTTTPIAGNSLVFYIERNGANAADTLTKDALLLKAEFTYSS